MTIDDQAKKKRGDSRRFWRSWIGAVTTVLAIEGVLVTAWTMSQPEPLETILLEEHQRINQMLQASLEEEQKETQDAKRLAQSQIKLKEARYENLHKKHGDLSKQLGRSIQMDGLPSQVRASTVPQALGKIEILCQDHARVNPANVTALLAVLVEIQQNGTINTALVVKAPSRQSLYRQVQVLLQAAGAYTGVVNGVQADTFQAVQAFQTENKLKVDGKIGLKTYMGLAKLFAQERLGTKGQKSQHASSQVSLPNKRAVAVTSDKTRGS